MANKSLQERILQFLNGKKAVKEAELTSELEQNASTESKTPIKYQVSRILKNLHEGGFIERHETEHSTFVQMTPEGRHKLRNLKLSSPTSLVSTQWDGYWRMVILDIPESRKSERNSLRYLLKKAGFVCMKNSVWVSPLPFEHMFANIKKDMDLGTDMTVIVTQHVDPDSEQELLKAFGLI